MAFEATKREWSELYAFFRLLADGCVYAGTPDAKKNEELCWPVAMVQREEHDGTRQYIIEDKDIYIKGENIDKRIPREDFATVAELVLDAIRQSKEMDVNSPDGVDIVTLTYLFCPNFIIIFNNIVTINVDKWQCCVC